MRTMMIMMTKRKMKKRDVKLLKKVKIINLMMNERFVKLNNNKKIIKIKK